MIYKPFNISNVFIIHHLLVISVIPMSLYTCPDMSQNTNHKKIPQQSTLISLTTSECYYHRQRAQYFSPPDLECPSCGVAPPSLPAAQSPLLPSKSPWHLDSANGGPRWANRAGPRLYYYRHVVRGAALRPPGPDLRSHSPASVAAQHWFREIYQHTPRWHYITIHTRSQLTFILQIPGHSSSFIRSSLCAKRRVIREERPPRSSGAFYCFLSSAFCEISMPFYCMSPQEQWMRRLVESGTPFTIICHPITLAIDRLLVFHPKWKATSEASHSRDYSERFFWWGIWQRMETWVEVWRILKTKTNNVFNDNNTL